MTGTDALKQLLWFEQKLTAEQQKDIQEQLDKVGVKCGIVSGVRLPHVVDLR